MLFPQTSRRARPRLFVPFLPALLLAGPGLCAAQVIYTYDAVPNPTSIPNNACRSVTVNVPDSFSVGNDQVALGIDVTHARRSDLSVEIDPPEAGEGNRQVMARYSTTVSTSDDPDNFRIMLSTNGDTGHPVDDGDNDAAGQAVRYRRLVQFTQNPFDDNNSNHPANGNWVIRVCDGRNNPTGTLNSVRLVLRSSETLPAACSAGNALGFDWGANGEGNPFSASTPTQVPGLTLSQGATSGEAPNDGGSGLPSFVTRTTTQGNHAGYYAINMDTSGDTESSIETSTFLFSEAVHGLEFSLLDVDRAAGGWEDYVRIEALGPQGERRAVQVTLANAQLAYAGDWVEADSSVDPTSSNGNVTYRFSGPVSQINLQYAQGDDPQSDSNFQIIGVSDFSFCAFDFGDAPASYGTTLSATGARHALGYRNLVMGTAPDGDADGAPGVSANDDGADEDGLTAPVLVMAPTPYFQCGSYSAAAGEYCVSVAVNNALGSDAQLVGWLDLNNDGDFNDAGERSIPRVGGGTGAAGDNSFATGNVPNGFSGTRVLVWTGVSTSIVNTSLYARLRLTTDPAFFAAAPPVTGLMRDGEVEDHLIPAATLPVTLAWVSSTAVGDGLRVEFATATETDNVGFSVVERDASGLVPLHPRLIESRANATAETSRYEIVLERRPASGEFYLVDHDTRGRQTAHGPYRIGESSGRLPDASRYDWTATRNALSVLTRQAPGGATTSTGRLWVSAPGFHRVTHGQLLAAGVDLRGQPVDRIAIRFRGAGVARRIVSGGAHFDAASYIDFPVEAAYSLYTKEFPYLIAADGIGVVAIGSDVIQADTEVDAWYWATRDYAPERSYNFASPTDDPWYADRMLAYPDRPAGVSPSLRVDAIAAVDGFAPELRADLVGVTNWPGSALDHHVELLLEGQVRAEAAFDGARAETVSARLDTLGEGELNVQVRTTGRTGFDFDVVNLDRVSLRYPRRLVAEGGRLAVDVLQTGGSAWGEPGGRDATADDIHAASFEGLAEVAGMAVDGLSDQAVGYAYWNGTWRAISARQRADGVALWPAAAGARYWFGETSALGVPRVDAAPATERLLTGRADYIIVSHGLFLPHLAPLVARQEARGLSVRVVDVAQIFAQFNDHVPEAVAIQRYLDAAVPKLGAQYVLLVGADTYDYKNFLGTGSVSLVPTRYAAYGDIVRYAPADGLYADADGDGAPEVAIGRLPVRSVSELQTLLAKWNGAGATSRRVLLATPADENAAPFRAIHDGFAARLPTGWALDRAYVDDLGLGGARTTLRAALNQRLAMLSFVGHSAPGQWSFDPLLTTADLSGKTGLADLVVQWGCWNSYFVAPSANTLAHAFLLTPGSGAAAVIGVSSLTNLESHEALGNLLYPELTSGARIGDALRLAKMQLAAGGEKYRDILVSATLLGDPAQPVQ